MGIEGRSIPQFTILRNHAEHKKDLFFTPLPPLTPLQIFKSSAVSGPVSSLDLTSRAKTRVILRSDLCRSTRYERSIHPPLTKKKTTALQFAVSYLKYADQHESKRELWKYFFSLLTSSEIFHDMYCYIYFMVIFSDISLKRLFHL